MTILRVDAAAVRELVSMADAVEAVRDAFRALNDDEFEMPLRTALHDGGFLSMAVHHRPSGSAVTKTLSLSPFRTPAIVGTLAWTDLVLPDTLAIEAGPVTSLRTGAVIGAATDVLAPAGANRLVVIGAGGMALDQVRAVAAVRSLESVHVVARRPERAAELARQIGDELPGVAVRHDVAMADALAQAQIVCCVTSSTQPLFEAGQLPPQVHVNAVGSYRPSMRELPVELLGEALVVVDQRHAVMDEAGEILDALAAGVLAESDMLELGPVLVGGTSQGTRIEARRTVFKSVGLAVQDWAIAHLLAQRLLR